MEATEGASADAQGPRSGRRTTATRRTTRRRAETRRRLVAAALETFAERGFYGASVEDICERAGFTRGAFYSNFATKEELFFALYAEQTQRLVDAVAAACDVRSGEGADPGIGSEIYQTALERFLAAQPEDRQWYLVNAEFTLHAVRNPDAARALARHRRALRAQIANLLTTALREIGRAPAMEIDTFVRVLLALYGDSIEQRYLEPDATQPGEFERQVLPALLWAVSAPGANDYSGRSSEPDGAWRPSPGTP